MTLSALNAPESDVDIEGLGDAGGSKKLDFDSGILTENRKSIIINDAVYCRSCFHTTRTVFILQSHEQKKEVTNRAFTFEFLVKRTSS